MYPVARVRGITNSINKVFKTYFKDEASLIWFGSWVRGDAYLQSDIDLAVLHKNPLDKKKLLQFWQYLDDFPTLYKIDFIDMNTAGKDLRNEILKNGQYL